MSNPFIKIKDNELPSTYTLIKFIIKLGNQEQGLVVIIKDIVYNYIVENYKWWVYDKDKGYKAYNKLKLLQDIKIQDEIETFWSKSLIEYNNNTNYDYLLKRIHNQYCYTCSNNNMLILYFQKKNKKINNFEHTLLISPTNLHNYVNIIRLCTCTNCIITSQKRYINYINKDYWGTPINAEKLNCSKTIKLCKYI